MRCINQIHRVKYGILINERNACAEWCCCWFFFASLLIFHYKDYDHAYEINVKQLDYWLLDISNAWQCGQDVWKEKVFRKLLHQTPHLILMHSFFGVIVFFFSPPSIENIPHLPINFSFKVYVRFEKSKTAERKNLYHLQKKLIHMWNWYLPTWYVKEANDKEWLF